MSKIYFFHGTMGAGKTLELIKAAYNYINRNIPIIIFTTELDNRFGTHKVASRNGMSLDANIFSQTTNFYIFLKDYIVNNNPHCIFIDESQLLLETQVNDLVRINLEYNIPIMCYGLKVNFKGKLFEGSKRLMEVSQDINEIKTICWCEKKATMNARIRDGKVIYQGAEIEIGGDESYIGLCLEHYMLGKLKN